MYQIEWITVLRYIIVVLTLLIVWKLVKRFFDYLRHHAFFKPTSMVPNKCNQFLLYISWTHSLYKLSRPEFPVLSLLLQGLLGGCCEVFEKERIFRLYLFHRPVFILYKPETVEVVLSSSTLTDKSVHYNFFHSWLGTGLFTSSGGKWRKHRKLLTPTFHFSILENFIPVFEEQSRVFVSKLKTLTREPWVDIVPLATLCTLDIICQTAMGVKINAQGNENKEYVQATHGISGAIINRAFRPWLYLDTIYYLTTEGKKYRSNLRKVHGFSRKVIKEKRNEMLERNTLKHDETTEDAECQARIRKAFLEFLLEYHFKDPSFTEEFIREEVDTFMFAGYDSTGMALSWILYCVGLYPEVQTKIVAELDEIFQNDIEREVTRDDLTKMKYLECTIKETFRLYTIAPFFMRECNETLKILGHTIYPGSFFLIFPYALHRDRESFSDPEKFIPERFYPENSTERHPYAYVPFSAGPRNCIGQKYAMMELKLLVANILRCLRITSLDPRDKVLVVPYMTLLNTKPLRLRFDTR
ncbi:unnamed protein product [Larinioides sclopetarius]|uniref:Cytochrome P450 n=2 Tax=Larinioides sclopetarius TaxID=280406 RepID=A0AAV2BZY6_9ARAC